MAKKPKKVKADKPRKVSVGDKAKFQTSTVDVRLYQLNETLATPFMRNGQFSFRLAFDKEGPGGQYRMLPKSKCPIITISPEEIIQTENETAQRMLEQFMVPTGTERGGSTRTAGLFFDDVTDTETEYDVDLDEVFALV